MKKIISIIAAILLACSASFAQTTVMGSRTFENTYVSVEGGAVVPFTTENFFGDIRPVAGVEFGKDFTPVVGGSIEFLGLINTTGAHTWFDQSNLVGNFKVNLSNWFGGYKGYPRRVEVLLTPGIGWGHDYATSDPGLEALAADPNYITINPGAQINFNMGKQRAWQIFLKPVVTWRTYGQADWFQADRAVGSIRVGLTYKFKSKSKNSHNFVACPYSVTKADYDAAMARIAELEGRAPERVEVVKEVPVEKVVEKVVDNVKPGTTIITFKMGSAKLSDVELAKVKAFAAQLAEGDKIRVIGSADLGTGSKERNGYLADQRASAVADVLIDLGFKDIDVTSEFDTNENAEASRAALILVR